MLSRERRPDVERRRAVLEAHGAAGSAIEELLAYTARPFTPGVRPSLPLDDEPHLAAWAGYAEEAASLGAFEALKRHFVQLRFPIRAGISQESAYRDATRKGRAGAADAFAPGLSLVRPEAIELRIVETIAGRIPVLVAQEREDFVALVQAFSERNEPAPVPSSMGACIVTGLNNWDRVASYRLRWTAERPDATDADWLAEFGRFAAQKQLYQDRFIILSRGPYSGISAAEAGMSPRDWLVTSLVIRREHECTHYFTHRVFGSLRNHVFDELVADFVGLVRAFGTYRGDLARRFLGLEAASPRAGGRIELYCGTLSQEAIGVVCSLAAAATSNLQTLADRGGPALGDVARLAGATYQLSLLTLEELASAEMPALPGAVAS